MSNNTASVIEAVAASEKTPFESISSEDMLAKTKKYNKKILEERERRRRGCFCKDKIQDIQNPEDQVDQEPTLAGEIANEEVCKDCGKEKMEPEKERCLIGCDVVALFPSLTSKRTGEIVRDRIMKSGLKFEGINYKQGLRYMMLNKHLTGSLKSLKRILPWRRKNGGTNPKMTGRMGSKLDDSPEEHWIFPTVELTEVEKREVVARCVEIGMRMIFENFCYKFGGETLRQDGGGPIGARVTMAAARLVMQAWSEEYLTILRRSGLVVDILTGYLDDVSTCLNLGMRYDKEQKMFPYNKETEMEDFEKKKDGESNNQRFGKSMPEGYG